MSRRWGESFESPMALPMEHRVEGRTSMEIQEEIIGRRRRREISGGTGGMVAWPGRGGVWTEVKARLERNLNN